MFEAEYSLITTCAFKTKEKNKNKERATKFFIDDYGLVGGYVVRLKLFYYSFYVNILLI